jgi:hypothetical protein
VSKIDPWTTGRIKQPLDLVPQRRILFADPPQKRRALGNRQANGLVEDLPQLVGVDEHVSSTDGGLRR